MARPIKTASSPDYRAKIGTVAEALFAERGFDGTSIREIAEQAGATKALIYHYYDSKEALYQTLLEVMGYKLLLIPKLINDNFTSSLSAHIQERLYQKSN